MPDVKQKSQRKMTQAENHNFSIIIVAAGRGARAGGGIPKQYQHIGGKPLLFHTIKNIKRAFSDALILLVVTPKDAVYYEPILEGFPDIMTATGGKSRQESVFNGLKALSSKPPSHVLIHDGARPFITKTLAANISASLASGHKAVIPALPITDTLKRAHNGAITETVSRSDLYSVQTPQAFDFQEILAAHQKAQHSDFTDDAAVFEHEGGTVYICAGDEGNFKVTRPEDFMKAEEKLLLACPDIRVGSGFDVHAFEDGDHVTLCGINVPHTQKLKGHSDADVGMHALTDALLSSIAAGDIGTHFPPTEEKWRGAASHIFLSHAADLVRKRNGLLSHVVVTLICEKPKIGPHVTAMRARLAEILNIQVSRVSVQATTTEKLGYTGRGEGIAAQATATIRLPLE